MKIIRTQEIINQNEFAKYFKYAWSFFGSVVCCVLIVGIYTYNKTTLYSVTLQTYDLKTNSTRWYKINSKKPEINLAALKSKALLQKTLIQLPFQISYFSTSVFNNSEIDGKNLAVKILLKRNEYAPSENDFQISSIDSVKFKLEDNNNTQVYDYGQPIETQGRGLTVIKSRAFSNDYPSIRVRFNDIEKLTERYYEDLIIKKDPIKKVVALNISEADPQKGINFLKKLMDIYINIEPAYQLPIASDLNLLDDSISKLILKLSNSHNKLVVKNQPIVQNKKLPETVKFQMDIFKAIMPYASSPADKFTQIPNTFGIDDATIKAQVNQFNKLQLEKQHILNNSNFQSNKTAISQKLANLQHSLIQNIQSQEDKITRQSMPKKPSNKLSIIMNNSKSLFDNYTALLNQRSLIINSKAQLFFDENITIEAEDSHTASLYLCAFFLGLLIPVPFVYFRERLSQFHI